MPSWQVFWRKKKTLYKERRANPLLGKDAGYKRLIIKSTSRPVENRQLEAGPWRRSGPHGQQVTQAR
jgi:hypothetical protein